VEHDSTERLLARLNRGLSGVIRGQIAICVINAILTGLGLLLLDVKFALLLAILAGFGSLVPIFGTIVSSIPALFIALTQSVATAVLLVFWILGIHFIEANILQPKIMGSAAKIHPAIIILALLAGEHTSSHANSTLGQSRRSSQRTTIAQGPRSPLKPPRTKARPNEVRIVRAH
jgi:predicted PurR-regulated permease PerM